MKAATSVVVALVAGVVLGVVVTRAGATATGATELIGDRRAWIAAAAVLALLASSPVTGALAGLAAMLGLLAALQVLPWGISADDAGRAAAVAKRELLEDTDWLSVPLLLGAAVAGGAVGTVRMVLRWGRRFALIAVALAALAVAIFGAPAIDGDSVLDALGLTHRGP